MTHTTGLEDANKTVTERTNMVKARVALHFSQKELADKMRVSVRTVIGWEGGTQMPRHYQIKDLRDILEWQGTDDELLRIFTIQKVPLEEPTNMDTQRRKAIEIALQAAGIAFIPGTALLDAPIFGLDQILDQCEESIKAGWELLRHGSFARVESMLNRNVPILTGYANSHSEFQENAASLAVQAMIQRIILATHKLDFTGRERYCIQAVHFGRLSGNPFSLATAMDWQGNTHIHCYRQPEQAIPIFNSALIGLPSDAMLNKSSLYSQLAIAHAQDKDETRAKENETKSRDYMEMARAMMPRNPELDPFYQCILFGTSELDQFEGRVYLYLSELLSSDDYARMAYYAFDTSLGKQAAGEGFRDQALIHKADAAIGINEMSEFITCMRTGYGMAASSGRQKSLSKARNVISRIPESWQNETAIKNLLKDLDQVPIVTVW